MLKRGAAGRSLGFDFVSELAVKSAADFKATAPAEAPELSVVLPCLNEIATLVQCIDRAQRAAAEHAITVEVIVADNGSTDGSQSAAAAAGARVVTVHERGYGNALLGGIAAARGRYIIMADSDGSYDLGELPRFVEKLREGFELVMGNRFRGGIKAGAMPPLHRYLGNPVLSGIGRLFFHSPCRDFHCGMRGFTRTFVDEMNLRSTGMEFASEMVVKATLHKKRIAEVPASLSPDGRDRPPHLRTWRDGWRHLRFMLLFSPRWLFLYPGLLLVVVGLAVGAWLLGGPRKVGSVTLDVHTLLYAGVAILVGFQAIAFSVFSKVFAITERLLPEDPRLNTLFRYITLEVGLAAGALLVAAGLAGSVYAVGAWGSQSFGPLEPSQALRIVIPSVVALSLGCQTIVSSFFLSLLGMGRR